MSQIICKDLSLGYDGNIITHGVSFTVNHGDYLCIVGENGSGKSTLIKTLLGLIKPLSGSIETSDGLLPSKIGYLPQQTEIGSDFPASVREVVMSGLSSSKGTRLFFGKAQKNTAKEKMKMLGISGLSNRSIKELSGGQRQRVLLARALCAADDIILLDEPASGLDPKVTAELYDILIDLNQKAKMTVVMVSHDISAALKYATHILHIGNEYSFFGTTKAYLKSDIGMAFTRGDSK